MTGEIIEFLYELEVEGRELIRFPIRIDADTSKLVLEGIPRPDWALLQTASCPGCTLPESCTHCPVAVALGDVVEQCAGLDSHTPVKATATMEGRRISMETTMQVALRSVVGLLMACSGCPSTAMLRPMARFHVPFATPQESLWRSVSNYLLAQYMRKSRDLPHDFNLEGLTSFYDKLHAVNVHLAQRLRTVANTEPNLNAIILLDIFAQEFPFAIQDSLSTFELLYEPYFTGTEEPTA